GLTEDEFLWEPAAGMWSVRRRGETATSRAFGPGEWVLDYEPIDPFQPGPLTTIAWRVLHLTSGFAGRWEWTFGDRRTDPARVVEFTPVAGEAMAMLYAEVARWVESVAGLSDEQLDTVGFGQYPAGLDSQLPFVAILWWT